MKGTLQHTLGDIFTAAIKEGLKASGIHDLIFGKAATPTSAATGGLLGALAHALHLPGSSAPAVATTGGSGPTSAADITQRQIATNASQTAGTLKEIYQTEQQEEVTLQQILAAIRAQHTMAGGVLGGLLGAAGGIVGGLLAGGGGGGGGPYDEGGKVPSTGWAMVHAGEHVLTSDQVQGIRPMPDLPGMRSHYGGGAFQSVGQSLSSNSSTSTTGDIHVHVNGVQDPRSTAREVANTLKQISPSFQAASVPYSS